MSLLKHVARRWPVQWRVYQHIGHGAWRDCETTQPTKARALSYIKRWACEGERFCVVRVRHDMAQEVRT